MEDIALTWPEVTAAIEAALIRTHPELSGRALQTEIAWQIREVHLTAAGRIRWGASRLGSDLRRCLSEAQNHRCCWCGARPDYLTFDHVLPINKGGSDHPDNLVMACEPCNRERGNLQVWNMKQIKEMALNRDEILAIFV